MGISCRPKRGKTSPRRASWASAVHPNGGRPAQGEHHGHQLSTQTRADQPKASIMGISCPPKRGKTRPKASIMGISCPPKRGQTSQRRASWASAVHANAGRPDQRRASWTPAPFVIAGAQQKVSIVGISCTRGASAVHLKQESSKSQHQHHTSTASTKSISCTSAGEPMQRPSIMSIGTPPEDKHHEHLLRTDNRR